MLTVDQLSKVDNLRKKRDNYEKLLRAIDSQHVQCVVGLMKRYNGLSEVKDRHDMQEFFSYAMTDVQEKLTAILRKEVIYSLECTYADLDKYITKG